MTIFHSEATPTGPHSPRPDVDPNASEVSVWSSPVHLLSARWFSASCSVQVSASGCWTQSSDLPVASYATESGSGEIVATVGGAPISAAALERELMRRGGHVPGRFDNPADRKVVLDELIRSEVLALSAERAGFAEHPDIVAARKRMLADRFWREQIAALSGETQVSDEEIQARYEAKKDTYRKPERLRASLILLGVDQQASAGEREQKRAEAQGLVARARESADDPVGFARLAREHSTDASRSRGGDIGWLVREARNTRLHRSTLEAVPLARDRGRDQRPD